MSIDLILIIVISLFNNCFEVQFPLSPWVTMNVFIVTTSDDQLIVPWKYEDRNTLCSDDNDFIQ